MNWKPEYGEYNETVRQDLGIFSTTKMVQECGEYGYILGIPGFHKVRQSSQLLKSYRGE
jgi:hypothetical protein